MPARRTMIRGETSDTDPIYPCRGRADRSIFRIGALFTFALRRLVVDIARVVKPEEE